MVPLLSLAIWLGLVNLAGYFTWGYGPLTFASLVLLVGLLLALDRSARRLKHRAPDGAGGAPWNRSSPRPVRLVLYALVAAGLLWSAAGALDGFARRPNRVIDIGKNTYVAARLFLRGENPYTSRAQLAHQVMPGPHVEAAAGGIRMYGVPYYYGYPYFPAMFLLYIPAVITVSSLHAIRVWNLVLLAIQVAGIILLARRPARDMYRREIVLTALAAYLGAAVYPRELFVYGVVDILPAALAILAMLALARRRDGTSGVLLGAVQACKLLPGPLLAVPVLLAGNRGSARRIAVGYAAASLAIVLPFVLWNPGGFLSATVLYYLTYHAGGDNSSLWFFLPGALRPPFLTLGFLLAVWAAVALSRRRHDPALDPMMACFCSYVLLMAFSKMTHLNYLWTVYPFGCIVLARLAWVGTGQSTATGRDSRPDPSRTTDPVAGKV